MSFPIRNGDVSYLCKRVPEGKSAEIRVADIVDATAQRDGSRMRVVEIGLAPAKKRPLQVSKVAPRSSNIHCNRLWIDITMDEMSGFSSFKNSIWIMKSVWICILDTTIPFGYNKNPDFRCCKSPPFFLSSDRCFAFPDFKHC